MEEVPPKCSEYYSQSNYIGFKRLLIKERRDVPFNYRSCVKVACLQWKVRKLSNIKLSIQFKVDITKDDLVDLVEKTQNSIMGILERDYITNKITQKS